MARILDVAGYILENTGVTTTMKLQKLAFYSQAHALATIGKPLFEEDFEAWVNGPVSVSLYSYHRGKFLIRPGELDADTENLEDHERRIVDEVCSRLSRETGNALSDRTHAEEPWQTARGGAAPSEYCRETISKESMTSFYRQHPVI